MKRLFPILLLLIGGGLSTVAAEVELLLKDGQILRGSDVNREEGQYLLQMGEGNVIPIPIELVEAVKLSKPEPAPKPALDERTGLTRSAPQQLAGQPTPDLNDPTQAPSGIRNSGSQVLAGDPIRAPRTSEQLGVFGGPAQFQKSIVPNEWRPESDWDMDPEKNNNFNPSEWANDIVDHSWTPEAAYTQETDVTNFAPSTWQKGIDIGWKPEDGFKKTGTSFTTGGRRRMTSFERLTLAALPSGIESRSTECSWCPDLVQVAAADYARTVSASRPTRRERDARRCATELFEPLVSSAAAPGIEIGKIGGAIGEHIPFDVFQAAIAIGDEPRRMLFATTDGECRLLNGELDRLLGVDMTESHRASYGTIAYNEALGDRQAAGLTTTEGQIDYAFAVYSLLAPGNGEAAPRLQLLVTREQLDEFSQATATDEGCEIGLRKRNREAKRVAVEFVAPRVEPGSGLAVVEFQTWSDHGGEVRSHTVYLSSDGKVSVHGERLAMHVGDHKCGHGPTITD